MHFDNIVWTSFRTLEPNPFPYTPLTQSIFNQGLKTSALAESLQEDSSIAMFHRGYLFSNINIFRRFFDAFLNAPDGTFIKYFKNGESLPLDDISFRPSAGSVILSSKMSIHIVRALLRGITVKQRLPDQPPVDELSKTELLSAMEAQQTFLTKSVEAHALFSGLAEAYPVGLERITNGAVTQQQIQGQVSQQTRSTTSKMAQQGSQLQNAQEHDAFLDKYGHRCAREMEIAIPRWRDDASTLRSISAQHQNDGQEIPTSKRTLKSMLIGVLLSPGSLLERLRENPKNEWLKSYAYLRDLLLEIGKRATNSGYFTESEDVFYLSWNTVKRLLENPPSRVHTQTRISQGQMDHNQNRSYKPPLFLDADLTPIKEKETAKDSDVMHGFGVSGGQFTGRAIKARSPEDVEISDTSEPYILVTEYTDAGWTPLFYQVDGLVMQHGSLLSHGSIVAREAQIPAVVNVANALSRIENGDWIKIDGKEGQVQHVNE